MNIGREFVLAQGIEIGLLLRRAQRRIEYVRNRVRTVCSGGPGNIPGRDGVHIETGTRGRANEEQDNANADREK